MYSIIGCNFSVISILNVIIIKLFAPYVKLYELFMQDLQQSMTKILQSFIVYVVLINQFSSHVV